ncbi:hypothetical protein AVEN_2018-1 [Araneus ventricosus]|uniref:Uncharacterized protein n=1 Tax=Araneus ventricosus TaxID=182803 RepID=A0A4Y2RUW6_ARAVE|nr:hypothetical protein AVEN_2018-1 [Araneus ventricosus]
MGNYYYPSGKVSASGRRVPDRSPPHVSMATTITVAEPVGWTWDRAGGFQIRNSIPLKIHRMRIIEDKFSLVTTSRFEATRWLFGMDLVILNHGQMTRTNLSWQPLSKLPLHTKRRTFDLRMI